MPIQVKVMYKGEPSEKLDKAIRNALEGAGMKWFAQGYNFETEERDICFDYWPTKSAEKKDV